jgi:hypothetical protein
MDNPFQYVIETVEPIEDSIDGRQYRCALTLWDGTHLPCVVIHSKQRLVELAKRRIKEGIDGQGILDGDDPYGRIISRFVPEVNRIDEYDVKSASPSPFAPPISLLRQIHGETTMAYTGWVFEMSDGKMFSYGSDYSMEFLELPDGYSFADVAKVHNHSYVGETGELMPLQQGGFFPDDYRDVPVFHERLYFRCATDYIR